MQYHRPFLSVEQIHSKIAKALIEKQGFSLIRVGDGETRVMAHGDLIPDNSIPNWMPYTGVTLPDQKVKQMLIGALRKADVVGLPIEERWPEFKFLMIRIISRYGLKLKNICPSRVNFSLWSQGYIKKLVQNQKIILVGRQAKKAKSYFEGFTKVLQAYDLPDISSLEETLNKIRSNLDFSIALVSAGIPAKILCVRLAELGKIAIDFGHVMDKITNPKKDILKIMSAWLLKHPERKRPNWASPIIPPNA